MARYYPAEPCSGVVMKEEEEGQLRVLEDVPLLPGFGFAVVDAGEED